MKKFCKYLIASAVLLLAAAAVTGCSQWAPVYEHMDDEGYSVSVRFDANGGVFANREGASLVDVFKAADHDADGDGTAEIKLIAPDDEARKTAGNYAASRPGYFLAGWYTERTPRVNEQGEAVDDYGELVSVSGREQGYTYGGKWDFEKDRLTVDLSADTTAFESQMVLYAAWIPYFNFEFYAQDENGTFQKIEADPVNQLKEITLPAWDESTGRLNMGHVPARENMTFVGAFLDEDMTQPVTGSIAGEVNEALGVGVAHTIKLYTTWREGNWFKIYTADQLYKNSSLNGSYEILADLDFVGKIWSPTLASGEYKGTILGNGHTIRNVTVNQGDISKINGGLFGSLGTTSKITDLTFENATYSIAAGSRMQDASFGVLAGTVNAGAALENVTVSGQLILGKDAYPSETYNVGLLVGSGTLAGVEYTIDFALEDSENNPASAVLDEATGRIEVTYKQS